MSKRGYSYLDNNVKHSLDILAETCIEEISSGEPPINFEYLYENGKLKKTIVESSSLKKGGLIKELDKKKLEKVRGILLVQEKQVFVVENNEPYEKRINFVLGHEFAHWRIPSHKALLFQCTQFDLSYNARHQLEIEANYFASELGFMGNIFFQYLQSSALSFQHIKKLSDIFNMSIEATLRRSIEIEERPCALLSLSLNKKDEEKFLQTKYVVHSEKFSQDYGEFDRFQAFPRNHILSTIVTDPIADILKTHECEIHFGEKKVLLKAELWKNRWNIFVLVQPKLKSMMDS